MKSGWRHVDAKDMKCPPRIIEVQPIQDDRGYFVELIPDDLEPKFTFQNQSYSQKGVFRGLHAQTPRQTKLVRCISGSIRDYVFDPFISQLYEFELSSPFTWLLVPNHCLHGFMALEESIVHYCVDVPYEPDFQIVMRMEDALLQYRSDRDKKSTHDIEDIKRLLK
jgi:dTDP-4-dehydrorhamnose 3,5-epimerase-like enzyme